MKTLIICESVHHGCTKKIADAMAATLNAEVKKSGEVDSGKLGEYDLIGFGSGIYMGKMHKNLVKLVDNMPKLEKNAFIFSTAGSDNENMKYHKAMKEKLASKGLKVVDEFSCRGFRHVRAAVPYRRPEQGKAGTRKTWRMRSSSHYG